MSAIEIVRLMNEEEEAVLTALRSAEPGLAKAAEKAAEAFMAGGRVVYAGAGTSGRIATMDAAEMAPTFGIEPDRFVAVFAGGLAAQTKSTERAEDDESEARDALAAIGLGSSDVLIGLAASGTTPYVLAAISYARDVGAWSCGIANNPGTPVLETADLGVLLDTGPEVLTGSTRLKAGTAQKLALNRISTAAMVLCRKVVSNLMVDVKASNEKLRGRCVRIVCELTGMGEDEAREGLENCGWNIRKVLERER
ncbi:MAG TPA: N-acetylmuramic acid 6-phosphate etherase [Fimbriimonadaceae bacterium]|nr:N-acetylmuramic acid 6-phosphate etherase [Fimbriimonadaceae bacterium]